MYIIQNLKTNTYAIFGTMPKVIWHANRQFASHIEHRDEAEEYIYQNGLDRDQMRIIKVDYIKNGGHSAKRE